MVEEIQEGMLVKVGDAGAGVKIHITTVNREGRIYERDKSLRPGQFLFGTVEKVWVVQKEILRPGKEEDGVKLLDEEGKEFYPPVVVQPKRVLLRIVWDGPRYRTSTLPEELVNPAINQVKRAKR